MHLPHKFLDNVLGNLELKNDAALARALNVKPSHISKIRHGKLGVSAGVLLAIHEKLDVPVAKLRSWM